MLSIDSQIWIYYLDPNAPEGPAVTRWFEGEMNKANRKEGGILNTEEILLSVITPIEVAHTLFKSLAITKEEIECLLRLFISHKQIRLVDVSPLLVWETIRKLKGISGQGIEGRDALILATMDLMQVGTIASHDKSILRLQDYARIDPVFQPPLILARGEAFNQERYTELIKQQHKST